MTPDARATDNEADERLSALLSELATPEEVEP